MFDRNERIAEYLKKHHTGKKNAASSHELEAVFHLRGSKLRRQINALRCNGNPICSDKEGYYFAANKEELAATIMQLNSRISKMTKAKKGLIKAILDFDGDIQIIIPV